MRLHHWFRLQPSDSVLAIILILDSFNGFVHAHTPEPHDVRRHVGMTLQEAENILAPALAAIRVSNKLRVEQQEPYAPAPHLPSSESGAAIHSIPEEVQEAARMVAESQPQIPGENQAQVADRIKTLYRPTRNDTNAPEAVLVPAATFGAWPPNLGAPNQGDWQQEHEDEEYWMVSMARRGHIPYYDRSDYQVWRNVRDFGAKGDGSTDDTAAINKAISDGRKCSVDGSSSEIRAATVFFPPGTYLVSSSIFYHANTEIVGDPRDPPRILAASSFIGLGVIASDVHMSYGEHGNMNQGSSFRSIRNLKIDIRLTDPSAYICGIQWNSGPASSLENIEFYMLYSSERSNNTQQGLYVENGSGGSVSNLTFVGGNIGAHFAYQQVMTSGLLFVNCNTAAQVHWNGVGTLHDFVISSCETGLAMVRGSANGDGAASQVAGSLTLVDSLIANTRVGIVLPPLVEGSTSFLAQNVGFFHVRAAIQEKAAESGETKVLVPGGRTFGDDVILDSWGFGNVRNVSVAANYESKEEFIEAREVPIMNRSEALIGDDDAHKRRTPASDYYSRMGTRFFTRRRPVYYNDRASRMMDVKALGAKGDGKTDDGPVLNTILQRAANTSSIVYFPYGTYLVRDTIFVLPGCRIIGQAWPAIVAAGPNFMDEDNPRPLLQVGKPGDSGVIEIQNMLITQTGATAGVILIEWNIRESSRGSAALWDTHVRAGGAFGSVNYAEGCHKNDGKMNSNCKGASMLMHMTTGSTSYLENVCLRVVDHNIEKSSEDQIDAHVTRGLLIESSHAWLWGTSVEGCTLYQYQLNSAENILLGGIHAESPHRHQPVLNTPHSIKTGLFPSDPTFSDCQNGKQVCAPSWALRVLGSSTVYTLGAGIYSWLGDDNQECRNAAACQQRGVEIVRTKDLWIYNLVTKAVTGMVPPRGKNLSLESDPTKTCVSSTLAWLHGSVNTGGHAVSKGFVLWPPEEVDKFQVELPPKCRSAVTQRILCERVIRTFGRFDSRDSIVTYEPLLDDICNPGCKSSLESWTSNVASYCAGYAMDDGTPLTVLGGRMYYGYNQTCLKDKDSDKYCHDIISEFTTVDRDEDMPDDEMCSYCHIERHEAMQRSPFSNYNTYHHQRLQRIYSRCGTPDPTDIPDSLISSPDILNKCPSGHRYLTMEGDTCDSIALLASVSSAFLQMENADVLPTCNDIRAGLDLCIPFRCERTLMIKEGDSCLKLEFAAKHGLRLQDIRRYNPWVDRKCRNLWSASSVYGHVICLSPQTRIVDSTIQNSLS